MEENMNQMIITVTDRCVNIKCRTDDEIKDKVYNTQHYIIEF